MKRLLCLSLLVLSISAPAWAQSQDDDAPGTSTAAQKNRRVEDWLVGAQLFLWSEEMRFKSGSGTNTHVANFNGAVWSAQKETFFYRWGWSGGLFIGTGKAAGGDGGDYNQNRVIFTLFGGQARVFTRLSGRANLGTSVLIFNRGITWPTENSVEAESGKNPNVVPLVDINLRLSKHIDLYQGMGPTADGNTLWRVGANLRF